MAGKSTQEVHPWRAALRTAVQTFLPLVLALILVCLEIVDAFADVPTEGAAWATLAGITAGLAAVAGALARAPLYRPWRKFSSSWGSAPAWKPRAP